MHKTSTRLDILQYIVDSGGATPAVLKEEFSLSRQAVHRHLRALITEGSVVKWGSPPIVIYVKRRVLSIHSAVQPG
ncbi:helix-turn-helix transcriptional regulator [Candidatus Woesebacteria bacterium]|nr:helix-turn-helix transcriptional regulator [Candidatus Woesebacteria bacterium]